MRILHTMLRVGDLARSIDFYTNVMGMTVLRKTDRPEQKYTLAFVGYGILNGADVTPTITRPPGKFASTSRTANAPSCV